MVAEPDWKLVAAQLADALEDAQSHLEYCGWGDAWERECAEAQELPAKIEAALNRYSGANEKEKRA